MSSPQTERSDQEVIDHSASDSEPLAQVEVLHLTLQDGMGYRRDFVKRIDQSLDSMICAYQTYSSLPFRAINIARHGVLLDHNRLIESLHVHNGDILHIVVNPTQALVLSNPATNRELLTLSPTDALGLPYDDPYGSLTREDEDRITIIIEDPWPGMTAISTSFRALRCHNSDKVISTVQGCFRVYHLKLYLKREPVRAGNDRYLYLGTEHGGRDTVTSISCTTAACRRPESEQIELRFLVANHNGKQERGSLICTQHDLVSEARSWAQERFGLGTTYALYHEQTLLHDKNDLSDEGFRPGGEYDIQLTQTAAAAWLHGAQIKQGEVPRQVALMIRQDGKRTRCVTVDRRTSLGNALRHAGYQSLESLRPVYEGTRFQLSDLVAHVYLATDGNGVQLLAEQTGGSGPRARANRPIEPTSEVPGPAPPGSTRLQADTTLGILSGAYTRLPSPRQNEIRLQIQGKTGPWGIIIGKDERISFAFRLIQALTRTTLRFCLDGETVHQHLTPSQLGLEDGDQIDVFIEQTGGGPLASLARQLPDEDVQFGETSITNDPRAHPRPSSGEVISFRVRHSDGTTWHVTLCRDTPIRHITCALDSLHGAPLRYLLDGDRLQLDLSPRSLGLEEGDELDAMSEQLGGGDVDPPQAEDEEQLDDFDEQELEDDRYSETRFITETEPVQETNVPSPTKRSSPPSDTVPKIQPQADSLPWLAPQLPSTSPSAPAHAPSQAQTAVSEAHFAGLLDVLRPYRPPGTSPRRPTTIARMLGPETKSAKFYGEHAQQFIRKYEQVGRLCEATPHDLIECLAFNVSDVQPDLYTPISHTQAFITRDWEGVKRHILGFDGPLDQKYTILDLETFIHKDRELSCVQDHTNYTLQYREIADLLKICGKITPLAHVEYYVRGLPDNIRQELRYAGLKTKEPTFDEVEEAVRQVLLPDDFFSRVEQTYQRDKAQKANSALIKGPSINLVQRSSAATQQAALLERLEQMSSSMANAANAMERLAVRSVPAQSTTVPPPFMHNSALGTTSPTPATGPNSVPLGTQPPQSQRPPTCAYCNSLAHFKNSCPHLREQVDLGNVMVVDGRVCWLTGTRVPGQWGTLHAIINEHARNGTIPRPPAPPQATSPPAGAGTMQTNVLILGSHAHELQPAYGYAQAELPEPEGFEGYETLNTAPKRPLEAEPGPTRVLRSRPNASITPPGATPPGSSQVVTGAPSAMMAPLGAMAPSGQATATPAETQEQASPVPQDVVQDILKDAPGDTARVKKIKAELRSRTSYLTRNSNPDSIAAVILDLPVTLTVGEVLGISTPVQKVFLSWVRNEALPIPIIGAGKWGDILVKAQDHDTPLPVPKHPTSAPAPATGANPPADEQAISVASQLLAALSLTSPATTFSGDELADRLVHRLNNVTLKGPRASNDPWYSRGLPMVKICINGWIIDALVDCGSQINVMREDLHKDLRLPVRMDGQHTIIGAGKQESVCVGVAENVPTDLSGHTVPLHYFVQTACTYPVILGMSALKEYGIVLDCSAGSMTMRTPDGRIFKMPVVNPNDRAHQQEMEAVFDANGQTLKTNNYNRFVNAQHLKLAGGGAWATKPTHFHVEAKRKALKAKALPSDKPPSADFKAPQLGPVPFGRDPYSTPLSPHVPPFAPTEYWTAERIAGLFLGPEGFISKPERDLLLWVLEKRKAVFAWDIGDIKVLSRQVCPGFHINVEQHTIFQDRTIPYSKAARVPIKTMFAAYIKAGILEPSLSPYVTAHFPVPKKDGTYRLIFNCESINRITTPCAYPPPLIQDYIDGFVGRQAYSMMDMFQYFQQLPLAEASRRYFAIVTPFGLLQPTRLVPGSNVSPGMAQRVSDHVVGEDSPEVGCPFVDDLGHKGPVSDYGNELVPGTPIRRWVWEFAVSFERLLYRVESAGLVINGNKLIVITDELDITGVKVSKHGKRPDPTKVATLQDWPNPPPNQSSLRGFLGLANYLRSFIPNFAELDAPLRELVGKRWAWSEEAGNAMNALKDAISPTTYLSVIDYQSGDEIVLSVDSSQIAAGFTLTQVRKGERVLILYDSVGFTDVERRYSQPKLELCGVYKAFRKLRYHLVGVHFTLEVDAISLMQMINQPDVTNAAMARWIANMKLLDFTIKHVPGRLHVIPDGLSRTDFGNAQAANDWPDEDHFFQTNSHVIPARAVADTDTASLERPACPSSPFRDEEYEGNWRLLGLWLATGGTDATLTKIPRATRRWISSRLNGYLVEDGRLWKRNTQGPHLLVLGKETDRQLALYHAHEQNGHRGRGALIALLLQRVWWEGIRGDCHAHVRSCGPCQLRDKRGEAEPQRSAPIPALFESFALDIVDLGSDTGSRRYLVLARCLLTGWVEGRALSNKLASSVAKFIEDDILSRYGPIVRTILTDNGPENAGATEDLLRRMGLKHARITPNHPQGNAVVERGHAPVVEGLLKTSYDDRERTASYLPQVLWADRITTRATTGFSPYELAFGHAPLLPIDHDLRTLPMVHWDRVTSTEDLLAARARLLKRRDDDLQAAATLLAQARAQGRSYADTTNANKMREALLPGTLVLISSAATVLPKSQDRWMGPYRVHSQLASGSYKLTELDGTVLTRTYGSDRLRRYFARSRPTATPRSFLDDADDGWSAPAPTSLASLGLAMEEIPADLSSAVRPVCMDDDLMVRSIPTGGDANLHHELPFADDTL